VNMLWQVIVTWLEALLFSRREHAMERDRVSAKLLGHT
jgi:hypothetical protein